MKVVAPVASGKKNVGKNPSKMGIDLSGVPKEDDKIIRPGTNRKDQAPEKNAEE